MLVWALFLNGLSSHFVSAIFKRQSLFLLVFFAFIILNIEILSLFKLITGANIIILTLVEAVITGAVWLKNGKPSLKRYSEISDELLFLILKDKSFIFLLISFAVLITSGFLLAAFCPAVEPDAQSYHCLRALFWLKDGFISHVETPDARLNCMPINSEIFYTWILALTKKDIGFGLLEFFSCFSLIASGYKIMELLNIEFEKRIWAILIFFSFASTVIQISSTQTDLLVSALISLGVYYAMLYKKEGGANLLFFSSLSFSIAAGVKTTALMALIPVFLWLIFYLKKSFLKFIIFSTVNFIVFSSYNYILNFIDFNNIFSSQSFITYNKMTGGIKGFISNLIKYLVQFVDFSGFQLGEHLNRYVINFRDFALSLFNIPKGYGEIDGFAKVNINMDEQIGAFGVLGFLVFLPCSIAGFFNKKYRLFSFFFWGMMVILCSLMSYTPYGIRYIITFTSIAFPVLGLSYFKQSRLIKPMVVLLAVFYAGYASLFLHLRPFVFLKNEVIKHKSISYVQNKMRNLEYPMYAPSLYTESAAYYKAIEPYCSKGNKIGFFIGAPAMIYRAKYFERNRNCKIDLLNATNIEKYNLKEYKALVTAQNNFQILDTITKTSKLRGEGKFWCEKAAGGFFVCKIKDEYLNSLGFYDNVTYMYLQTFKNGIKNYEIRVKTR